MMKVEPLIDDETIGDKVGIAFNYMLGNEFIASVFLNPRVWHEMGCPDYVTLNIG